MLIIGTLILLYFTIRMVSVKNIYFLILTPIGVCGNILYFLVNPNFYDYSLPGQNSKQLDNFAINWAESISLDGQD